MSNIKDFPEPQNPADISLDAITNMNLSFLEVLHKNVDAILASKARHRISLQKFGRELENDGIETRARLIGDLLSETQSYIKQGLASDAANTAARAAYMLCELGMMDMPEESFKAIRESVRIASEDI